MTVAPSDLRKIPLFQNITDEHLRKLMGAFERAHLKSGEVLFQAGSKPEYLYLLVSGEISIKESDDARITLSPIAPLGELGALTAIERRTTAATTKASEVWRIGATELMDFFERHGDVAFPFHNNLLRIVADKIRRDAKRLDDVRANLIRTQKAMKKLREVVLEAEETPISKTVCETLDDLIERNRRGHYNVEPAFNLATSVRLDGGEIVPVTEMSDSFLRLGKQPKPAPKSGEHWSAVLILPEGEIPVSGTVHTIERREGMGEGLIIKLDLLIADYEALLTRHLTRVQMLDFVV